MLGLGLSLSLGQRSSGGTPTPADFLVTSDAEFATANTNATAGQIIQLQDSGTFTALTLTNATGVTVRGQTAGVPTLRSLTINQARGAKVTGLKVQANSAPSSSPKLVDILGNCDGLDIDGNDIRGGNPWNSYADFDPSVTDTSRMGSSGTGWSPTAPYNTDLWYGIGSSGSGATLPSGSITIRNNVITDVGAGIKFGWGSSAAGAIKINGNRVGRVYADIISIVIPNTGAEITGIEVCGNELFDAFSQPQDNGNPHTDAIQISVTSTYAFPLVGVLIAGNILWYTPSTRGEPQRIFSNGFEPGYPYVGPVVIDNVMLSRVTTHGITLNSNDGEGVSWGYIYRNIVLANPTRNALIQNEGSTNSVSGIGPSSVTNATIAVRDSTNYGSPPSFLALNTCEALTSFTGNELLNNVITGLGTTEGAYATWFDTDTSGEWDALTSADATIAALTHKSAYADRRPMVPGETSTAFRERWAVAANRPWSSLPSWTGWVDLTGVTASSTQTSEWAFVHAGNTTRAISITGGEYRIASDRAGTGATAWGSSASTIAHGQFLQVRQTASASGSTATTLNVTIGSETYDWTVTTASAAAFPIVALDSTTPDLFRITGAANLGSDGQVGTLALMRFKMASAPASQINAFFSSAGTPRVQINILTTGKIRVGLYNAAGTRFAALDTTANVCDGNYHDIMWSWDTSDASSATGASIYLDGSSSKTATTWTTPATISYSSSITSYQFGAPATKDFEIGALYINTAARVDITSAPNLAKFNADQIGTTGTGPSGAQPVIFLVGNAAQWNDAGGLNRGGGSKFVKVGSAAATDVSGSAWS